MRVFVCGSRDYTDRRYMWDFLDELAGVVKVDAVIEGGARGADMLAGGWALDRGIPVDQFDADWTTGRGAGMLRNRRMLLEGKPDLVVAFPLGRSRGTWHMVRIAREAGIPTWVLPRDRSIVTALGEGVFV